MDQLRRGIHEQRGEPERPHRPRQTSFDCLLSSHRRSPFEALRRGCSCYMPLPPESMRLEARGKMISVPSADPVGALVPHTLKESLVGAKSGPLTGTSFMVKDLFAIKGRKVSNGNPDFY